MMSKVLISDPVQKTIPFLQYVAKNFARILQYCVYLNRNGFKNHAQTCMLLLTENCTYI